MTRPRILRDERFLALAAQVVVGLGVLGLAVWAVQGVVADLRAVGLAPGIGFLDHPAGFGIGEGPAYSPSDPYRRALVVGLANTLRVSLAGVALATMLGVGLALLRLSGNPLATRASGAYIEAFRNTPLLVQLFFWYWGVVLQLPPVRSGLVLAAAPGAADAGTLVALSQRGLAVPSPQPSHWTNEWLAIVAVGLVAAALLRRWRERVQARTGAPARGVLLGTLLVAVVAAASWWLLPEPPYRFDLPRLGRFNYVGGAVLTPEFTALLFGLVAYTGAFIAEVVRAGIEAVSRGQREAALALGLGEGQVTRLVILPQALRVIVPPLTSQYLNLTKNSSLAIAIGFPDLFNVSRTIGNQTGQAVILTGIVMGLYLAVSLATSAAMNLYHRRVRLVER